MSEMDQISVGIHMIFEYFFKKKDGRAPIGLSLLHANMCWYHWMKNSSAKWLGISPNTSRDGFQIMWKISSVSVWRTHTIGNYGVPILQLLFCRTFRYKLVGECDNIWGFANQMRNQKRIWNRVPNKLQSRNGFGTRFRTNYDFNIENHSLF